MCVHFQNVRSFSIWHICNCTTHLTLNSNKPILESLPKKHFDSQIWDWDRIRVLTVQVGLFATFQVPNALHINQFDCTSFSQRFLLAAIIFYAFSQQIRICFLATSNMMSLSATTKTFLQHLVYFCENYQPDSTIWTSIFLSSHLKHEHWCFHFEGVYQTHDLNIHLWKLQLLLPNKTLAKYYICKWIFKSCLIKIQKSTSLEYEPVLWELIKIFCKLPMYREIIV